MGLEHGSLRLILLEGKTRERERNFEMYKSGQLQREIERKEWMDKIKIERLKGNYYRKA